jgi:hypothetical protein
MYHLRWHLRTPTIAFVSQLLSLAWQFQKISLYTTIYPFDKKHHNSYEYGKNVFSVNKTNENHTFKPQKKLDHDRQHTQLLIPCNIDTNEEHSELVSKSSILHKDNVSQIIISQKLVNPP